MLVKGATGLYLLWWQGLWRHSDFDLDHNVDCLLDSGLYIVCAETRLCSMNLPVWQIDHQKQQQKIEIGKKNFTSYGRAQATK